MGTSISQHATEFHIRAEYIPLISQTLDALEEDGWECIYALQDRTGEKAGDIIDIEFIGEKLGEEAQLFEILAPYVEKGSYIEFTKDGSDDYSRWYFTGRAMIEQEGTVVYLPVPDEQEEGATV